MTLTLSNPAKPVETDRKITLSLPAPALKVQMATEDTTMRILILKALSITGYDRVADEIRDRRRR